MGKPMAANLLKAGFPVVIWNRTRSRGDELVQQGATWAETPFGVFISKRCINALVNGGRQVRWARLRRSAPPPKLA